MVARVDKSVSRKLAIGSLAGRCEGVNDRLPLRQLVSVPMGFGFAFSHHRCDEAKVTVLKRWCFLHSVNVAAIHGLGSFGFGWLGKVVLGCAIGIVYRHRSWFLWLVARLMPGKLFSCRAFMALHDRTYG